jgi:hypothetical protein
VSGQNSHTLPNQVQIGADSSVQLSACNSLQALKHFPPILINTPKTIAPPNRSLVHRAVASAGGVETTPFLCIFRRPDEASLISDNYFTSIFQQLTQTYVPLHVTLRSG